MGKKRNLKSSHKQRKWSHRGMVIPLKEVEMMEGDKSTSATKIQTAEESERPITPIPEISHETPEGGLHVMLYFAPEKPENPKDELNNDRSDGEALMLFSPMK